MNKTLKYSECKHTDKHNSSAYLVYYHSYNNLYKKWVDQKRKEKAEELHKKNQSKPIQLNQPYINNGAKINITPQDFEQLFNISQKAYGMLLTSFFQISVQCILNTEFLINFINLKMQDYLMDFLLPIAEEHPQIPVLLEFIAFKDYSVVMRITAIEYPDNYQNKNNVNLGGKEIFDKITQSFKKDEEKFFQFLISNYKVLNANIKEFQELNISEYHVQKQENNTLENSFADIKQEELNMASETYIRNRKLIMNELNQGVFICIDDIATIFKNIKFIFSTVIQKQPQYIGLSTGNISPFLKAQELKNKTDNKLDETIKKNQNKNIKNKRKSSRNSGNHGLYNKINDIETNEQLFKLILQKNLLTDIQKHFKNNQSEQQTKQEQQNKFKINIIN